MILCRFDDVQVNTAMVTFATGWIQIDDIKFKVISGGGGKGVLPIGLYKLGSARILSETTPNYSAYLGVSKAWFVGITPLFKTDRTELGIHPDGNVLGTAGCIGIYKLEQDDLCFAILSKKSGDTVKVV